MSPCNCFCSFLLISDYVFILLFSSVAWIIGWALILEYTVGGSTVARGISPNLVSKLSVGRYWFCFLLDVL